MIKVAFFGGLFFFLTAVAASASIQGTGVDAAYKEKISIKEGSRGRRGRSGTIFFVGGRRGVGGGGLRGGK